MKPSLNWSDAAAVARWLLNLRVAIGDAESVTEDRLPDCWISVGSAAPRNLPEDSGLVRLGADLAGPARPAAAGAPLQAPPRPRERGQVDVDQCLVGLRAHFAHPSPDVPPRAW